MTIINIKDPEKGGISYNLNEAISFKAFLSSMGDERSKIQKVADIVPSNKVSGYGYDINPSIDWRKHNGWVYVIAVDEKVVKIGMSETTLSSRFSSYQAGTLKARIKGTCSVTNFYCSEFIRQCHRDGKKIKLYAYPVPVHTTIIDVLGEQVEVQQKLSYIFEKKLMERYEKLTGTRPLLCRNCSL